MLLWGLGLAHGMPSGDNVIRSAKGGSTVSDVEDVYKVNNVQTVGGGTG